MQLFPSSVIYQLDDTLKGKIFEGQYFKLGSMEVLSNTLHTINVTKGGKH